jgi:cytidine deaminase
MPVAYDPIPSQFIGKGTVWLAPIEDSERDGWAGYWDLDPDGPPTPLEKAPGCATAQEAVAWGRARTPRIFIRLQPKGEYWWAGVGPPPAHADVTGVFAAD